MKNEVKSKTPYFNIVNEFYLVQRNNKFIKPVHASMYLYIVNSFNSKFWPNQIGLPTDYTMHLLNIGSYNTFKKTFNDLIEFGLINEISKGENQYQSRIIALSFFDKSPDESPDKSLIYHLTNQLSDNNTIKQLNNNTIKQIEKKDFDFLISSNEFKNYLKESKLKLESITESFNFRKELLNLGIEKQIVEDWLKVRKTKKATNTETSFNSIKNQIKLSGISANECIKIAAEKDWKGFKAEWIEKEHPIKANGNKVKLSNDAMMHLPKDIQEQIKLGELTERDAFKTFLND